MNTLKIRAFMINAAVGMSLLCLCAGCDRSSPEPPETSSPVASASPANEQAPAAPEPGPGPVTESAAAPVASSKADFADTQLLEIAQNTGLAHAPAGLSPQVETDRNGRIREKLLRDNKGTPLQRINFQYQQHLIQTSTHTDLQTGEQRQRDYRYSPEGSLTSVQQTENSKLIVYQIEDIQLTGETPIFHGQKILPDGRIQPWAGNPYTWQD